MTKKKKIFIAGHKGLVGSALSSTFKAAGYCDIITRDRKELDLTNQKAVDQFFKNERPDWVLLAAAKVGGIHGNSTYPVEYLIENLNIQNNVITSAHNHETEKLLFLGSSCIYPKNCPQPIKEEYLLTDKLEPTNEPYALAKICGIKLCSAMNRQYGKNFISVMPSNLYGPNDNYHNENAHVLPMLIRRFHEHKLANKKQVTVWGTGKPMREFLYSLDLAEACLHLMEKYNAEEVGEIINIGTGKDVSIRELAETLKEIIGYQGELVFDSSKPDGTKRKVVDTSKINSLGWNSRTSLKAGIELVYSDFINNTNLRK
jgi:GDP-L-fucose synthase